MSNAWDILNRAVLSGRVRRAYIWGSYGLGKSYTSMQLLAKRLQSFDRVFQVTLSEDMVVQELLGHYVPHAHEFVWHDGPVACAMRNGGLVVNELPRASGAVRDLFLAVTDDSATASIALPTGDKLRPHDGFTVIATGNQSPDQAGLDPALLDRFDLVLEVKTPHPDVISCLNKARKGLGSAIHDSYLDPERLVSPRQAFAWLRLKEEFGESEAASLAFGDKAEGIMTVLAALA